MAAAPDPIRLARLCHALGHPARLAIYRYARTFHHGCPLGSLHAQVPLAQSTTSQHVKVLVQAGLLASERRSTKVMYRAVDEALGELRRGVAGL